MQIEEVLTHLRALPGVLVQTAGPGDGSPEAAWGDSFACYDPDGDLPPDRRWPFVTVVASDYPGFDTLSRLDRPGVFRVNVSVGRRAFEDLLGYPPAAAGEHAPDAYDAADVFLPHPLYATQGWVSVVCPGNATSGRLVGLLTLAHQRAADRHRGT